MTSNRPSAPVSSTISTVEVRVSGPNWLAISRTASTPSAVCGPMRMTIEGATSAAAASASCSFIASKKRRIVFSASMARSEPTGIFLARPEQPAEGKRLAVKDLFDTAGLTTTYGSIVYAEHVPEQTAEAVSRLEAAGYANVGKTNLHEFAYGITSVNPHYGTVRNPAYPGRVAGGSSGGSAAALAAGLADAALGSDSGGSIRIPAACCGVTGFKPTWGLVPIEGCFPLAPSFDHAGPMARDVDGCERMLEALVPGFDPTEVELDDVEVGLAWTELADPLVRARVEAAAERFPRVRRLELALAEGFYDAFSREVADVHRELFAEHADSYGENVRPKIEWCLAVTDAEYERACERRERYREQLAEAAAGVDLV